MNLLPPKRFIFPKDGNRPEECEDCCQAAYPLRLGSGKGNAARLALSDGASEAAFARDWAQILARDFVARTPDLAGLTAAGLEQWLAPCQESWRRKVPWERLPWHGEAKTRAGSLATLLGLTFFRPEGSSDGLHWQAVAVGDSCLFRVRDEELALAFPLDDASQFGSAPALLCSNPANNGRLADQLRQHQGSCQPGDVFILASDALAAWFLARHSAAGKPWQTLLALEPAQGADWVPTQRQAGLMRNDDTAFLIAQVG